MGDLVRKHQERGIILFFSVYVFIINYMQIFSYHEITYLYPIFWLMNILILFYFIILLNSSERIDAPRIRWLEIVFWLLVLSIDISKLYNKESNFVIITFIIFGQLIPTYLNENRYEKVIYANLLGIFPFFLHAAYSYYSSAKYYNNSMGVLLLINSYFIIAILFKKLKDQNKKVSFFILIYLILNSMITYFTGSRTALLATILMIFCFLYYLMRTFKIKRKGLFISTVFLLLYLGRNIIVNVLHTLFIKWEGNGLDFSFTGRTGIWSYAVKNYEVFGGGKSFFMEDLNVSHGHNALFNLLGFYGVAPFIFMLIILVYGFYLFKKIDNLNYRLYFILFMVVNTFEGLIGGPEYSYFQLLFFLHFGFLLKNISNPIQYKIVEIRKND